MIIKTKQKYYIRYRNNDWLCTFGTDSYRKSGSAFRMNFAFCI